jgi:hypothetical protein
LIFKRNIFGSYVSQIYMTVINIVMVPLYVRYMGTEAYGLVGFFAMLQAWFQLLDIGLTPTLAPEGPAYSLVGPLGGDAMHIGCCPQGKGWKGVWQHCRLMWCPLLEKHEYQAKHSGQLH